MTTSSYRRRQSMARAWVRLVTLPLVLFVGLHAHSAVHAQEKPWAIFVMRSDGSQVRKLVQVPGCKEHSSPRWSHDGKRVVFSASTNSWLENSMYVVNADGSGLRKLGRHVRPDWSPDDKQIIYDFYPGGGRSDVYVQGLDGGGRTQLATGCSPRWSPDGRSLAVSRRDNLFVMDLVTGDAHDLLDEPVFNVFNGFCWSPDGSELAVIVRPEEGDRRHCLIVSAGGEKQGIRKRAEGEMGGYISFSPDGKQLAYSDDWKIRIIDVNGTGAARRLPGQKGRNRQPDWSPDGEWILFSSDRDVP